MSRRDKPKTRSKPVPPAAPAQPAKQPHTPTWLVAILLGVAALCLYWPATGCDFINFDDDLYVTDNAHVQSGLTLASVKWAFFNQVSSNWHPLTLLSHMLDCQLYGLKPWGPHLTNVLLNALNTALVFVLVQQMTGARWRSTFVAALFAVHPLHVESVAWVSERKDVLSGFFGLLSLIFYSRYAQSWSKLENPELKAQPSVFQHPARDYGLALLFLALGLMSKAMLVTWPCVMLLLDYWPLKRFNLSRAWRLVVEKIPFFVLAAAACVITLAVQQHAGAVASAEQLPLAFRFENALVSYCRYLGMFFWPINLAIFYPLQSWPMIEILSAALFLVAVSVLLVVKRQKYPYLLMGWLWFLGTLVPVIGLVQAGDQSLADRYMYLPSLGLLIFVIWGGYEFAKRWQSAVPALAITGAVAALVCVCFTEEQLGYWKDSEILFTHALAVTKGNYIADNNLAAVYLNRGDLDKAITLLQAAVSLKPTDGPAIYNLGLAYYATGQFDNAISEYQKALHLDPHNSSICLNLGNVYVMKNQMNDAIAQYRQAIQLDPANALAYNNLAESLDNQGRTNEALAAYRKAIQIDPNYVEAHNNLGYLLQKTGRVNEAIAEYQEALRLRPDYELAHNNLMAAMALTNAPFGR